MTTPTTPTDAMVEAGHQASMLSSAAGKDHIRDILRAALQHQEPAATPPAPSALDMAVADALNLFRSVIQSGESWSADCQRAYDAALEALRGNGGGT